MILDFLPYPWNGLIFMVLMLILFPLIPYCLAGSRLHGILKSRYHAEWVELGSPGGFFSFKSQKWLEGFYEKYSHLADDDVELQRHIDMMDRMKPFISIIMWTYLISGFATIIIPKFF